jgi:hypothetical protein
MNEDLLRERLRHAAAAADVEPGAVDAAADVERGRRGLKRRRMTIVGGSMAATAVVVASGIGVGQLAGSEEAPGSTRGAPIAGATKVDPEESAAHDRSAAVPTTSPRGASTSPQPYSESTIGARDWRYGVYDLAKQHLDPQHAYLNYDTDSLQGGGGAHGARTLGIKLGWSAPGEAGEGMIQIAVASPHGRRLIYPCAYFGPCHETRLPDHGPVVMSGEPRSGAGYAVIVTQDDGEYVQVVVDPLFGNNSLTPTDAGLVSLDKVLSLAEDPDLDLP